MAYTRAFRKTGELIRLGENAYRILGVAGFGGSSVVYHAAYRDGLNTDQEHVVLIKELYPYHPDGKIYRNENGEIRWTDEARELMEESRQRFRLGNQANLELLKKLPSQTSGNYNSFEAYGTYYSVLAVHGGLILEDMLETKGAVKVLREAAVITLKILDALEGLHQSGLLHLDISPDNILLLPEQAMLIDYNSVWRTQEVLSEAFVFSGKEGYAAPELRLEDPSRICFATDIYSVCAVFYRMITGCPLTDREFNSRNMYRRLCRGMLEDEPQSAVSKTIEIVAKGLHVLPRKRYPDIASLRCELKELIERIDGKGVSHSALWESSRSLYSRMTEQKDMYLAQNIALSGSGDITLGELYGELIKGRNVLLKGPGGIGKTRLLRELWGTNVKNYREDGPVVYYIPLKDYQENQGEASYIRRYFLRQLCFSHSQNNTEDALHELERMFEKRDEPGAGIILLLDGLNEAGSRREKLLREIEGLGDKPGVGILVTERTEEVREYALKDFCTAQLLPLTPETVRAQLESRGIPVPEKGDLRELLSNPMMLKLYEDIISMEKDRRAKADADRVIGHADDLVGLYIENLCTTQLRIDAGNESLQLCHRYILRHLLPAIALTMTRKRRTLLSSRQMYRIVRQSYRDLKNRRFGRKFPEFLGKSRMMLGGLSEMEWFDFAVVEQLSGNLGLVTKNSSGFYGLVHDNFQRCLAKWGGKNEKRLHSNRLPAAICFAVCMIVLDFVGIDRILPKKEDPAAVVTGYYMDVREVYDVIEGIHPVKEEDLPHMNSYWEIRSDGIKTTSAKHYQKGLETGSFAWSKDMVDFECSYAAPLYYNGRTTYQSVEFGNESGYYTYTYGKDFYQSESGPYRTCSFTRDDSPDYLFLDDIFTSFADYDEVGYDIIRVKEYYTEEGYEARSMFLDSVTDAESYKADFNRVAGLEFEYDALGRRTAQYYLDDLEMRIAVGEVYKREYVYDEDGNMTAVICRDQTDMPVDGDELWAYAIMDYDQWHNVTDQRFYDSYGNAATGPDGAEHIEFEYEDGNITKISYLDGNGDLQKTYWGYAVVEFIYDHGYCVSQTFLDAEGNPLEPDKGYAKRALELGYDEGTDTYYPAKVRYLDSYGNLYMNGEKYAGVRYEYTEDGTLYRTTMLGADGKPCDPLNGYAVIEGKNHAEYGGFQTIVFYDKDGREADREETASKDGLYLKWR